MGAGTETFMLFALNKQRSVNTLERMLLIVIIFQLLLWLLLLAILCAFPNYIIIELKFYCTSIHNVDDTHHEKTLSNAIRSTIKHTNNVRLIMALQSRARVNLFMCLP